MGGNMSATIKIENLCAVRFCKMNVDDFMVLTGEQAEGKSTIAKCIFLCRTIKDDVFTLLMKDMYFQDQKRILKAIKSTLRNKFLRMFGTSLAMSANMVLQYWYSEESFIMFSIKKNDAETDLIEKFVEVTFSDKLLNDLKEVIQNRNKIDDLKATISNLFYDEYQTIFIPAGRNLITLLTSQLNYLYATMDDRQKRMMDYTTQQYIEYILKIRPSFGDGLEGLLTDLNDGNRKKALKMVDLIQTILKGRYVYRDGAELLYLAGDDSYRNKYVRINFTSSGQQETVWIFNILFYLFVNHTKAFIIVEEPEAHLYPDAQKKITELLAYMYNQNCQMMLTTHSPYVLGALNNLIYADYIADKKKMETQVNECIGKEFWIHQCAAYQVARGEIYTCIEDEEEHLISNSVIDGASEDINELFDKLFDIAQSNEE
jgi:predicted ATP-dependent endonuclease of OLD family